MPPRSPDAELTPAEAARLHREASAGGQHVMWFVMTDDPAFPGCHVGKVHTADHHGGVWLPGALVADTLDEVVAMMPRWLTRRLRSAIDVPGVVETWD